MLLQIFVVEMAGYADRQDMGLVVVRIEFRRHKPCLVLLLIDIGAEKFHAALPPLLWIVYHLYYVLYIYMFTYLTLVFSCAQSLLMGRF